MLIDTSRFKEAEMMIRGELAKDLEDPYLFLSLARVLCEQRKFQSALDAVKEAITLEPDDPNAHYIRAMIYREQGGIKEGLKAIERAIAIDAEDEDHYSMKAGLLLDDGKWQRSLDAANQGLALEADDESCLFYRGLALAKLGREDEAEDDSLNLLGIDADDAANHVSRGWVLLEAGKSADATRHFSEALRIDSTREDAREGLAAAVVLSRPITGRIMTLIEKLDRVNMWVMIVGVVVIGRVRRHLEKDAGLSLLGNLIDVIFWGILVLILIAPLMFEWTLKTDKLTRHALSGRHSKGLKMATPFVVIGGLFFAIWVWGGTKSSPFLAIAVLALAVMVREMFESENRWVRGKMKRITAGVGAVVVGIFYSQFFIIQPMVVELAGGAVDLVEDGDSEAMERLASSLDDTLSLRKRTVVWPSLALALLVFSRDALSRWLHKKAPDDAWE